MRPIWLIEADVYRTATEPLRAEICRQGMTWGVVSYDLIASGYFDRVGSHRLRQDDCVIFYGTWPTLRQTQLQWSWVPGGWCSVSSLDCAAYFPHFRPYLLNRDHTILTGIEAISKQDELFASYGVAGRVFARPTGCMKLFNGRCIDRASFATALAPTRYDPATQVVIAMPRPIGREWRVVVCEDRPIAASQYQADGQKALSPGCPAEVQNFVQDILAVVRWRPDEVFVIDVCESEGRLHLLELNGFSCSGLYLCDPEAVVSATSRLAERRWQESQQTRKPSSVEMSP